MISDSELLSYHRARAEDLETLRRLERAAIATLQLRTGKYLGPVAAVTEYLNWRGWPMQLANEPVGAITTFKSWDGSAFTTVDASSYYVQGAFIHFNFRVASWTPLTMPTRYQVVYQAGYTLPNADDPDVWLAPEDIQQAVLLLTGDWFENREAVVVGASHSGELPNAVTALISGHIRAAF